MLATFGASSYLLLAFVAHFKKEIWFKISVFVAVMQLGSYLICALKNPGIVSAKEPPKSNISFACNVLYSHFTVSDLPDSEVDWKADRAL
jgi:hypothetical protein